MNRTMTLANVALALSLLGCPKKKTEEESTKAPTEAAHVHEPEHESLPKQIKLTKEVIEDAKIQTEPVMRELLAMTLALPGEVSVDPDKSARVSTPIAGRLVDIRFAEGSTVKKGDLLALVRVPEIEKVRGVVRATSAKAIAARANAERLGVLAGKGLASKQEALTAVAEADAFDAESRASREQLSALGTNAGSEVALRAPIAGVVVTRDAVVGQPISTEHTIATIADLSQVWFLGRVFEKDLGQLFVGEKAEVQLNAYPKEHFEGSIEYLGRQIDPVARTVTARIRLVNRDDLLRLGLFGTARVSTGDGQKRDAGAPKSPSLVVPRTAVVDIGGKPTVFVRLDDDDFDVHEIVVGTSALGKVEVLSGLREGEQVVVEGAFTLKSMVLKGTLAEDEHE